MWEVAEILFGTSHPVDPGIEHGRAGRPLPAPATATLARLAALVSASATTQILEEPVPDEVLGVKCEHAKSRK